MAKKLLSDMSKEELRDLLSSSDGFRSRMWRNAIDETMELTVPDYLPEGDERRFMTWDVSYSSSSFGFFPTTSFEALEACVSFVERLQKTFYFFTEEKFERLPDIEKTAKEFLESDWDEDEDMDKKYTDMENTVMDYFEGLAQELVKFFEDELNWYDNEENLLEWVSEYADLDDMYISEDDPETVYQLVIQKVC